MYDVFLHGNPTHGPFLFCPPSLCGGKKKQSQNNNKQASWICAFWCCCCCCCLHEVCWWIQPAQQPFLCPVLHTLESKSIDMCACFLFSEKWSSGAPPCIWIHKLFTRQTHLAVLYIAAVLLNTLHYWVQLLHRFHLSLPPPPLQPITSIRTNAQQFVRLHTLCKHSGTKDE